ncbi:MAG: hypothetical protein ABJE95_04065 [Byssovorax sp.]
MFFGKIVYGSVVVALGLFAAGCAADSSDPADVGDGEAVAETAAPLSVDHTSVDTVDVWDSGNINSLSAWMALKCSTTYRGGNDNYMLTGFTAFKEPTINFDNFIGKLSGTCTDYTTAGVQTGVPETDNIFTGNWRAGGLDVSVPSNEVPIGVKLHVYGGASSYVKDIAIASTVATFGGSTTWSSYATGYAGDVVSATCAPGKVMTGLQLKYNMSNGKIQHVQMFCRSFS